VNPVSSSHYNFSVPEYQGVIALIAPVNNPLLGLISLIAPALVGGNTVVCLASEKLPLSAISLGEVLHASDVPNGVVNILTGFDLELAEHFSSHKDVNGVVYCGDDLALVKSIQENASENVKRVHYYDKTDWLQENGQSPYFIMDHVEIKTTWHPVGS
jgi:acyl-CoA reductase-like NAD-dependent aldehyde dehydrogenase